LELFRFELILEPELDRRSGTGGEGKEGLLDLGVPDTMGEFEPRSGAGG